MQEIQNDAFYDLLKQYDPDIEYHLAGEVEYRLLRDEKPYEGLNHFFQTCSGWVGSTQYAVIRETMAPQVLEDIVNWLKDVTRK